MDCAVPQKGHITSCTRPACLCSRAYFGCPTTNPRLCVQEYKCVDKRLGSIHVGEKCVFSSHATFRFSGGLFLPRIKPNTSVYSVCFSSSWGRASTSAPPTKKSQRDLDERGIYECPLHLAKSKAQIISSKRKRPKMKRCKGNLAAPMPAAAAMPPRLPKSMYGPCQISDSVPASASTDQLSWLTRFVWPLTTLMRSPANSWPTGTLQMNKLSLCFSLKLSILNTSKTLGWQMTRFPGSPT